MHVHLLGIHKSRINNVIASTHKSSNSVLWDVIARQKYMFRKEDQWNKTTQEGIQII